MSAASQFGQLPNNTAGPGESPILRHESAPTNSRHQGGQPAEDGRTVLLTGMPYHGRSVFRQSPAAMMENAADMDREAAPEGSGFPCEVPGCKRRLFSRLCDLKKHEKTHSRPWKCNTATCKYHTHGWPTEKELERHINDKHSSSPRTFSCLFVPCPYNSKRESNLKQHMEKTHGWEYVRSRASKPFCCPVTGCCECTDPNESARRHGVVPSTCSAPADETPELVLFPDAAGGGTYCPDSTLPWDSYVPWPSPPSREQNISRFLRDVDSMIKDPPPLDPRLAVPSYVDAAADAAASGGTGSEHLSVGYMPPNASFKLSHSPPLYAVAASGEWTVAAGCAVAKDGADTRGKQPANHADGPITPTSAARTLHHAKEEGGAEEEDSSYEDDDSEEDEPPRKRTKCRVGDEFDDNKMPCPFREADESYFDRNNKEKFSPCHTRHKDISTIVRHLGRPAHQLYTDERCVSSFELPESDDERPRPQAGVCKKCWRIFREHEKFRQHLAQPCAKVSRGKREKFLVLYRAFCEPGDPAAVKDEEENQEQTESGQQEWFEGEDMDLRQQVQALGAQYRELESKNTKLESQYNKLESQHNKLVQWLERVGPPSTRAFLASITMGAPARDRDSLVEGMNSRQVEVSGEDFIGEAHRTLSGISSSSSKSSVHYVPPSPKFGGESSRHKRTDSGYGGSSARDGEAAVTQAAARLETLQEQQAEAGDELLEEAGNLPFDLLWPADDRI
jgi:hypothetical protein